MEKRLYRSQNERMIWGVCGGLAKYFDIDPTIVRVISVLMLFLSVGFVILAYLLLAVVVPVEPSKAPAEPATPAGTQASPEAARREQNKLIGMVLIIVGVLFLAGVLNLFWWLGFRGFWAFALVVIGVIIVLAARKK